MIAKAMKLNIMNRTISNCTYNKLKKISVINSKINNIVKLEKKEPKFIKKGFVESYFENMGINKLGHIVSKLGWLYKINKPGIKGIKEFRDIAACSLVVHLVGGTILPGIPFIQNYNDSPPFLIRLLGITIGLNFILSLLQTSHLVRTSRILKNHQMIKNSNFSK